MQKFFVVLLAVVFVLQAPCFSYGQEQIRNRNYSSTIPASNVPSFKPAAQAVSVETIEEDQVRLDKKSSYKTIITHTIIKNEDGSITYITEVSLFKKGKLIKKTILSETKDSNGNIIKSEKEVTRYQGNKVVSKEKSFIIRDSQGNIVTSGTENTQYEYVTIKGRDCLSKTTRVTKSQSQDGSSESITRISEYQLDKKGNCVGMSATATGTRIVVDEDGGTTTYVMTNYIATISISPKGGPIITAESWDWTQVSRIWPTN